MAVTEPAPQPVVVLPNEAGWLHRLRERPDGTREGLVSWSETVQGFRGGLKEHEPQWRPVDQIRRLKGVDYTALERSIERVDVATVGDAETSAPTPQGWPPGVPAPGEAGWMTAATTWLVETLPPDYRAHEVVHNPHVLIWMAACHSEHALAALRAGYRSASVQLKPHLQPHVLSQVLATYQKEGARLKAVAHSIQVVGRFLRRPDTGNEVASHADPG
ncbi:hypothetical protein [Nonomuraea sp. NPDC050786]|uniref:hypothetical protein n=1 Tax=Nonomuraea sp. NPDC050786 TaxID=3154840 RepID=UPI0033D6F438